MRAAHKCMFWCLGGLAVLGMALLAASSARLARFRGRAPARTALPALREARECGRQVTVSGGDPTIVAVLWDEQFTGMKLDVAREAHNHTCAGCSVAYFTSVPQIARFCATHRVAAVVVDTSTPDSVRFVLAYLPPRVRVVLTSGE